MNKKVVLSDLEQITRDLETGIESCRFAGKIVRHVETGTDVFFLLYSAGTMIAGLVGTAALMIPMYGACKLFAKYVGYKSDRAVQDLEDMHNISVELAKCDSEEEIDGVLKMHEKELKIMVKRYVRYSSEFPERA